MHTDTMAVHAGRSEFPALGVHAPPLDLSSTYPFDDLDRATASLDSLLAGGVPVESAIYARLHNPTVARFEEALADLEGAEEAVAFASGMAAITACLFATGERGTHVVGVRPLYGGTDHLLSGSLLGRTVTWARPDRVAEAIRPDTAVVVMETPANPTLDLVDIASVVQQAGDVPVLVDSTFTTPVLQQPLAHGAAFSLHSATKFLGGHGDVLGGVVATTAEWARRLRQVRVVTGGVLHPLAGYLLHRGLQTLPIRVRAQQQRAALLARRLGEHPAVLAVYYPGLPGADPQGLIGRQQQGPGSLLAFRVQGGYEGARQVMRSLKLITRAVSLGSVDTLIQHPAGLTHRVLGPEARAQAHISDDLLRLSVGLEDVEDLLTDLWRGLEAISAVEAIETMGR